MLLNWQLHTAHGALIVSQWDRVLCNRAFFLSISLHFTFNSQNSAATMCISVSYTFIIWSNDNNTREEEKSAAVTRTVSDLRKAFLLLGRIFRDMFRCWNSFLLLFFFWFVDDVILLHFPCFNIAMVVRHYKTVCNICWDIME